MSTDLFTFFPNTAKYRPENAYWLGRAADLAYENGDKIAAEVGTWGFHQCRFFDRQETQAFLAGNDDMLILAFRGTEPNKLTDWLSDAEFDLVPGPYGQVHKGFLKALSYVWQEVRAAIDQMQTKGQALWITGHSLGAALATLATAKLRQEDKPVYGLYTFGQPRTGDRDFADRFNADFKSRAFRFVNKEDIVTRVPGRLMTYSHIGNYLYLDKDGKLSDDIGYWYRFIDCTKAVLDDLSELQPGLPLFEDHSMSNGYLPKLKLNINTYPA
ncbi:MAG: hypothetical protein RIR00_3 [Pseudomonadota bacterium]